MRRYIAALLAVALLMCCCSCTGGGIKINDQRLQEYALDNKVDLRGIICSQLILVCADGSNARVDCYERSAAGGFEPVEGLSELEGYISSEGIAYFGKDNDNRTPEGLFILGRAFGCMPDPGTQLDYLEVTENSCWITDPDMPDYNTLVETDDEAVLAGAERFSLNSDKYAYAVTVERNTDPVIRGNGKAVFIHCGASPTDGGIALDTEIVCAIIKWLKPEGLPCILICEA